MDTEPTDIPAAEPEPDFLGDFVASLTSDAPPVDAPPADAPPADAPPADAPPAAEDPEKDELGLDEPTQETIEEKPPEEEVIPEVPKNRKDWDTLRASRDRYKQSTEEVSNVLKTKDEVIQTLNTQLQELQTKVSELPVLHEKLKDLDSYEKELAVTRLEATREYKEAILAPMEAIGSQAATLAQTNETDQERVEAVFRIADPVAQRAALKEVTAGWDEMDRTELYAMVKDARVIQDKQESMRENAAAAAKEQQTLAAERERTEKEAARKEFTTQAKTVVAALKDKTPFLPLADGETAEDRYLALEAKLADVDMDTQSPKAKAFAAAAALLHPQMVKTIQKLQEENSTLKTRVSQTNSSKAKVAPNQEVRPPADEDKDFLDALGVTRSPMLSQSLQVIGQ